MTTLPPAGWYDDPEYSDYLRYWSGEGWSEHRSPKAGGGQQPTASGLSDVGDWLNQSFRALWRRRMQMLSIAAANVVVSTLSALLIARIWGDLLWDGESWSGFSAGRVWATLGLMTVLAVVGGIWYLAGCHQLYHARLGHDVPLGESLSAAVRALPRAIGWLLALAAAVVGALMLVILLGIVNVGLGLLGLLGLLIASVWVYVRLAFLAPALIVRVDGRNPLQASADVSRGRFWPVFGRLLLLALVTVGVSLAFSLVTAPFTSTDAEALERYLVIEQDEVVRADIGGLIDEMNLAGPAAILASLPGVATALVGLAATCALFAERYQVHPESTPGEANTD